MRDRYPWLDIRRKWEASPEHLTLSAFAKQVGIDKATISRRMRKEHWCRQTYYQEVDERSTPWPTLIDQSQHYDEPFADVTPDFTTDDGADYDIIEITGAEDHLAVYRDMVEQHRAEVSQIDKFRQAAVHIAGRAMKSNNMNDWKLAREATSVVNGLTKCLDAKQRLEIRAWRHAK